MHTAMDGLRDDCADISVIVPVYNVERWLAECVQSICTQQTAARLEIILVDDGSTDSSSDMCDALAADDHRIRVLHKSNGGLSDARNHGLDVATGRYVTFVDSDDALLPGALQYMWQLAQEQDCQLVCAGMLKGTTFPTGRVARGGDIEITSGMQTVRMALLQYRVHNSAWGKLYSRDLWREKRYRQDIGYEDLDIMAPLLWQVPRVAVCSAPVYFYRQHPGSYLHRFTRRRCDVLDVTDRLARWTSLHAPELHDAAMVRRLSAHINILALMKEHNAVMEDVEHRCHSVIAASRGLCRRVAHTKLSMCLFMLAVSFIGADRATSLLARIYRIVR